MCFSLHSNTTHGGVHGTEAMVFFTEICRASDLNVCRDKMQPT